MKNHVPRVKYFVQKITTGRTYNFSVFASILKDLFLQLFWCNKIPQTNTLLSFSQKVLNMCFWLQVSERLSQPNIFIVHNRSDAFAGEENQVRIDFIIFNIFYFIQSSILILFSLRRCSFQSQDSVARTFAIRVLKLNKNFFPTLHT